MPYTIRYEAVAEKQLARLDAGIAADILRAVEGLAVNPIPAGAKRLQGTKVPTFRIRVRRDWRVLYTVSHGTLVVLVVRVAHRREVYR